MRRVLVFCAVLHTAACGAAGGTASPAPAAPSSTPQHSAQGTRLPEISIVARDADLDALEVGAREAFEQGAWDRAAADFARLAELTSDPIRGAGALFHAAWAHDNAGRLSKALSGYEAAARRAPGGPLAREALVRQLRLLCHLERWERAGEVADLVLGRHADLGARERIVVHGAKALALVAIEDDERAASHIARARGDVERLGLERDTVIHRDVAQLYYALGEVRRLRGDRVRFDPLPDDFLAVLEQRCQLLLDAQGAYTTAMRAEDAHWSSMSGVRIGELYQSLHRDLLSVPRPDAAIQSRSREALFEGAMRLRYAILLRKGLTMMEHTVAMAERTGVASPWVDKARVARSEIEADLEREEAAVARLPYSRAELERAMSEIRQRGSGGQTE